MAITLTILCAAFLAALLVGEQRQSPRIVYVAKPLASLCFILVALLGESSVTGAFRGWVVAGLVLGLGGDVLLMLPGRRTFLAGLVTFLLGHVAYVVACALLVSPSAWFAAWSLVPLAAAALVLVYLWPPLQRDHPHMRGPVLAYVVVITTMVVAALAVFVAPDAGGATLDAAHRTTLLVGASLFFLSDIAVARQRFVAPGFANRALGLPAYYTGQVLVAWSAIVW